MNMKRELVANSLGTLPMSNNSVIRTATVAKEYRMIFEYASTKLLVKFFLKRTRGPYWINMDLWTRFWALINNPEVPLLAQTGPEPKGNRIFICNDSCSFTVVFSLDFDLHA